MCGIFYYRRKNAIINENAMVERSFKTIQHRGPDMSGIRKMENEKDVTSFVGFHRLCINDISVKGNQPFWRKTKILDDFVICNGEIYNHKFIEDRYKISVESTSDCEFLLEYISSNVTSLTNTFRFIDGVFAIVCKVGNKLIIARDRYGVKPLFFSVTNDYILIASEAKAFEMFPSLTVAELLPASYLVFNTDTHFITEYNTYYRPHLNSFSCNNTKFFERCVKDKLTNAVSKRLMSDRSISCLLSGGLDSSLIASILSKILKGKGQKLNTFTIGFPDSTDVKYARKVAEFLGTEHHEYIISYKDALKRLPDIVYAIETYDITTVRASTPMFLLCEYISKFQNPVVLSGEGSDEVFAGYLYFHNAPSATELNNETLSLITNLYRYDVLRADRCTSGNGLDLREPFLDKNLIDFMCSIDPSYKAPINGFEKSLLRKAFDDGTYLPSDVLWRRKAAFSDAVSGATKPWYKYIQEHVELLLEQDKKEDSNMTTFFRHSTAPTNEAKYYKYLFENKFKNYKPTVDYWLPKWNVNVGIEPSATALSVFNENEH
jgi:asparagine synthase (glutamine-hydrolysing)